MGRAVGRRVGGARGVPERGPRRAHRSALLAAAACGTTDHVLDVGCGTGDTTRAAARRWPSTVTPSASTSRRAMLARARERAAADGLHNVDVRAGRRAGASVRGRAGSRWSISRFGVMFFADPVAAFANIGRATVARRAAGAGRVADVRPQRMGRGCRGPRSAMGRPFPPIPRRRHRDRSGLADPDRVRVGCSSEAGWSRRAARRRRASLRLRRPTPPPRSPARERDRRDARRCSRTSTPTPSPGRWTRSAPSRWPRTRPRDGVELDSRVWVVTAVR